MATYQLIKKKGIVAHFFGGFVDAKMNFDYAYKFPANSGAIRDMLEAFLSGISGAKSGKYQLKNSEGRTLWSGNLCVQAADS